MQLDQEYSTAPSSDLYEQRLNLQTEFNLLTIKQPEHMLFRFRQSWYEHGNTQWKVLLEEQITVEDIKLAIGSMQSGMSPGLDVYRVEFFKTFISTSARNVYRVL